MEEDGGRWMKWCGGGWGEMDEVMWKRMGGDG